jgi:hypothetical protein
MILLGNKNALPYNPADIPSNRLSTTCGYLTCGYIKSPQSELSKLNRYIRPFGDSVTCAILLPEIENSRLTCVQHYARQP